MTTEKNPENSITQEIIDKVHITLADFKMGEETLNFLRSTEPLFMKEVSRFIQSEISRFKHDLAHAQAVYLGSVIGAAYISGFLIAREAQHQLFNDNLSFDSPIQKVLSSDNMDNLMDKWLAEGKSYKEIGRCMSKHLNVKAKKPTKRVKSNGKKKKRLNIDGLDK
jgi:hypothetical protein